jgi:hypothetical protein
MKKIVFFLLFSSVLIAFSSCKKDEPDPKPKNELKVDGNSYDINTPVFIILIRQSETTNGSIALQHLSESKIVQAQLAFAFNSAEGISGTYIINENESRYLDTWMSSYAITDIGQGMNMQSYNDLVSGTLTITDKGENNYEISFKMKPKAGSEIEGYYLGAAMLNQQNM